ncbi:hypothetical protein RHMOL_Rhmol05G0116500 [Rhododendron molle]|uniref:Uncharacterized protein n=1 Tax=Rhododendron molle TaxID=49168 RepID=A0ACC0NMR6_RHOML|nr:hypothetical protein RHMOL_Rhmol05G0116500 [Rhododendron molle]
MYGVPFFIVIMSSNSSNASAIASLLVYRPRCIYTCTLAKYETSISTVLAIGDGIGVDQEQQFRAFVELALRCVEEKREDKPEMKGVADELSRIRSAPLGPLFSYLQSSPLLTPETSQVTTSQRLLLCLSTFLNDDSSVSPVSSTTTTMRSPNSCFGSLFPVWVGDGGKKQIPVGDRVGDGVGSNG